MAEVGIEQEFCRFIFIVNNIESLDQSLFSDSGSLDQSEQ
jgi:hypothetical protein